MTSARVRDADKMIQLAGDIDKGLTERSPMAVNELVAGHTNMQSMIMAAQAEALLEITEQLTRIADALEQRAA